MRIRQRWWGLVVGCALMACEEPAADLGGTGPGDAAVGGGPDAGFDPGPGGRIRFDTTGYTELVDVDPARQRLLIRGEGDLWEVDLRAVTARQLTDALPRGAQRAVYRLGGALFLEDGDPITLVFDQGEAVPRTRLPADQFVPLTDAVVTGGAQAELLDLSTLERRTLVAEPVSVTGRPRDGVDTVVLQTSDGLWLYVRGQDALARMPDPAPQFPLSVLEGALLLWAERTEQRLVTADGTRPIPQLGWQAGVRHLCANDGVLGILLSPFAGVPERSMTLSGAPINTTPTAEGCIFHHGRGLDWLDARGDSQSVIVPGLGQFIHSTWPDNAVILPTRPPTLVIDPIGPVPLEFVDRPAPTEPFPNFLVRISQDEALMADFNRSRLQRVELSSGRVTTVYEGPEWRRPEVSADGRWLLAVEATDDRRLGIPFLVDARSGARIDLADGPTRIVSLGFSGFTTTVLPTHAVYLEEILDDAGNRAAVEVVIVPTPTP